MIGVHSVSENHHLGLLESVADHECSESTRHSSRSCEMRSARTLSLSVLLSALVVACGADQTTDPSTNPVGTFGLATVDIKPLPASFGPTESGGPWYVRGTLDLRADGTYTQAVTDSSRSTGLGVVTEIGKWTRATPDSLVLTVTTVGRESTPLKFSGNGLTRKQVTHTFAYVRR